MIQFIILSMISLCILPLLTAYILSSFGNFNKQFLVNHFGIWSQNTLGGLGVIIHELSHLLLALIFGHHIDHVKLLDLHRPHENSTMGYVMSSWHTDSVYESLGLFFLSIAPCFGCSAFLLLIHTLFWHTFDLRIMTMPSIENVVHLALKNTSNIFGTFGLKWLIFLFLIIIVSSTGYGLSDADWKGCMQGLPYWIVVVLFLVVIALATHAYIIASIFLWTWILILLTFLSIGIVYSLITLLTLFISGKLLAFFR